jgi:hypothetical protein
MGLRALLRRLRMVRLQRRMRRDEDSMAWCGRRKATLVLLEHGDPLAQRVVQSFPVLFHSKVLITTLSQKAFPEKGSPFTDLESSSWPSHGMHGLIQYCEVLLLIASSSLT